MFNHKLNLSRVSHIHNILYILKLGNCTFKVRYVKLTAEYYMWNYNLERLMVYINNNKKN